MEELTDGACARVVFDDVGSGAAVEHFHGLSKNSVTAAFLKDCKLLKTTEIGSANGNRMGYVSVHLGSGESKLFILRSPRFA
jgi:hypothetical protein